ncbi:2-hydroxy-3-oxopropionate reductase [Tamaricihabitans halophyticus]|uniref:2-hydroxy-3-oxopropionate reductase n=1 Tax=Tamaricihabitans halophyticus TaxID=1262583 RepID=A0A4R2R312_9PSEU|nr:2-hydroxy-3-oxopropionate reductase [Tamaricihabitans halophyticus]TCP56943.1 2-hydroxy-3-oxopropionate reductase [Tamaricihabitans halophyticus]
MSSSAQTIAFIGLGIMGAPMAGHLVAAGHQVRGHDIAPAGLAQLSAAGGETAGSVAEAVAEADVVITMLPNHPQVEAVVLGEDGVLSHAKPNTLLIDMSTIRPESSQTIARQGAERGIRVLDAPVSGGQAGAVEASLSIMVGGSDDDFASAEAILESLGTTIVHVGPAGAGQVVKAANQLLVAGIIALNAEALLLLESSGLDGRKGMEVLAGGLAGSTVLNRKIDNFANREFSPGFRIDLHDKDMGIVESAARTAGVGLPLAGQVAQLVAAAKAHGLGGHDHSALLALIEDLNGKAAA